MTMTTCAICGYDNVANTLFCEECGATLDAPAVPAVPATPDAPAVPVAPAAVDIPVVPAAPAAPVVPAALNALAPEPSRSAPLYSAPQRPETAAPATIRDTGDVYTPRERASGAPAPEDDAAVALPVATTYLVSENGRRLDVPPQDVVIVGREDMRSGIRPDVDLTLDGASAAGVSRRHCRLLRGIDGWRVEDLMSTNYTVLNGKPLPAHTPTPLRDGDELRLGKLRLRFHSA